MPLRKLQHRVDILDRLYTHLRRCNRLCDGQPGAESRRRRAAADEPHVCRPMTPGAVRRVHAILSAALNYAVSWGWIERNPADYAHPPKLARRRALPPQPGAGRASCSTRPRRDRRGAGRVPVAGRHERRPARRAGRAAVDRRRARPRSAADRLELRRPGRAAPAQGHEDRRERWLSLDAAHRPGARDAARRPAAALAPVAAVAARRRVRLLARSPRRSGRGTPTTSPTPTARSRTSSASPSR